MSVTRDGRGSRESRRATTRRDLGIVMSREHTVVPGRTRPPSYDGQCVLCDTRKKQNWKPRDLTVRVIICTSSYGGGPPHRPAPQRQKSRRQEREVEGSDVPHVTKTFRLPRLGKEFLLLAYPS